VLSISKLNASLESYQNKLIELSEVNETEDETKITDTISEAETPTENETLDKKKKRILTYVRNELVPIPLDAIAYV